MAPLVPRMHLFEIDDQEWFPPFLRRLVQSTLRAAWMASPPVLASRSAADHCADVLLRKLGRDTAARRYTFVDFCAGAGGPTPRIERVLNRHAALNSLPGADFVMTDLHPHVPAWERASRKSPSGRLKYLPESIDASRVDGAVIEKLLSAKSARAAAPEPATAVTNGVTTSSASSFSSSSSDPIEKAIFRMFFLAFHHFPDPLARAILRNCVETDTPFAIFELQDRSLTSALSVVLLGIGMFLTAPYFAWRWRSPAALIFTYLIPVLPFVIVFDGFVSQLRTRTPDEVRHLLKTCGAEGAEDWKLESGSERFLWPCGYQNWVVGMKNI